MEPKTGKKNYGKNPVVVIAVSIAMINTKSLKGYNQIIEHYLKIKTMDLNQLKRTNIKFKKNYSK